MGERKRIPDQEIVRQYSRTTELIPDTISVLDDYDPSAVSEFRRRGRPTEYFTKLDGMVTRLLLLGLPVKRVCQIIGIQAATYYEWIDRHPSFADAVLMGTEGADALVAASLFQRAVGYSHKSEKISINKDGDIFRAEFVEHYPPDTAAATYFLNNRSQGAARRGVARQVWANRHVQQAEDPEGNLVDPSKPPQFIINATTVTPGTPVAPSEPIPPEPEDETPV